MLDQILQEFWFSPKESKVYMSCLELWHAPVSSIARNIQENRVTTYSILKNLVAKWVAQTITKNKSTYYSVISPDKLLQNRENKCQNFKDKLPEFMAMASKFDNKPKVQFYEWLEWLKYVYEQIILSWSEMEKSESFLTFVWTADIDPKLQKYLVEEFVPWRLKYKTKTKAIISKQSLHQDYSKYNKIKHEHIVIDDPIFDIANEIIVHWKDKLSILMYTPYEMSALVITSQTLHNWLKSMFNLIWKIHKK
jgi:hypothetical protein